MVGCRRRHLESKGCLCPRVHGWMFKVGFPQLWEGDAVRLDSAHQGLRYALGATMAHCRSAQPVALCCGHKLEEAANVSRNAGIPHLAVDMSHVLLMTFLFLEERMRGQMACMKPRDSEFR